jgi:hypothetical protein
MGIEDKEEAGSGKERQESCAVERQQGSGTDRLCAA